MVETLESITAEASLEDILKELGVEVSEFGKDGESHNPKEIKAFIERVRKENGLETPADFLDDLGDIGKKYAEKGGVFYLALRKGEEVVGTIALSVSSEGEGEGEGEIKRFYLDNDLRGKGVGLALLNKIINLCKERGLNKCILNTDEKLVKAIEFYKKYGFKISETDENGKIRMGLDLTDNGEES